MFVFFKENIFLRKHNFFRFKITIFFRTISKKCIIFLAKNLFFVCALQFLFLPHYISVSHFYSLSLFFSYLFSFTLNQHFCIYLFQPSHFESSTIISLSNTHITHKHTQAHTLTRITEKHATHILTHFLLCCANQNFTSSISIIAMICKKIILSNNHSE